jgi:hypothetical protein
MGDLFGQRQSGVATFRVADPLRDEHLSEAAYAAATAVLAKDPSLISPSTLRCVGCWASAMSGAWSSSEWDDCGKRVAGGG